MSSSSRAVGLLTIGQAPRVDVMEELGPMWPGIEVIQAGALDGMNAQELAGVAPQGEDEVLTSRLANGGSVVMGKSKIMSLMQRKLATLEEQTGAVLIACSGGFPELHHSKIVVEPDKLLYAQVRALGGAELRVGVVCPLAEQVEWTRDKWREVCPASRLQVQHVSPYTGSDLEFTEAGRALQRAGVDVLIFDCIGYSIQMRHKVQAQCPVPALSARSVSGHAIADLFA